MQICIRLENKIKFLNIDIDKFNSNKYDLIISNPPYINKIDLNRLEMMLGYMNQS